MTELEWEKRVEPGDIAAPLGFAAGGWACGIKKGELDLGVILCEVPAVAAAVYTRNQFQAAPLQVTRAHLEADGKLRAVVVNSGNANAATGQRGLEDARRMAEWVAQRWDIPVQQVAVASTGVIGEFLPMDKLQQGIERIQVGKESGAAFATAICTTDTREKTAQVRLQVEGKPVTVSGVAKGAGMIHPNMATMLAFVTTDAVIDPEVLDTLLRAVVEDSFNSISVDGDTSTNDMVLMMASQLAGHGILHPHHPDWPQFFRAVKAVCQSLAKQIARDGEGATRLIEVQVEGAREPEMAREIARKVASSLLVKTAIFGGDANWGRIVMAVGNSGYAFDPDKVSVDLGEVRVVDNGMAADYAEEEAAEQLQRDTVRIRVHLGEGLESATAWGCDLSYDYVKMNGSYRT